MGNKAQNQAPREPIVLVPFDLVMGDWDPEMFEARRRILARETGPVPEPTAADLELVGQINRALRRPLPAPRLMLRRGRSGRARRRARGRRTRPTAAARSPDDGPAEPAPSASTTQGGGS